jgi:hypothetical protein
VAESLQGALHQRPPRATKLRLADKLEIHPTPLHDSWLNMAEVELAVISKQ